MKLYNFFFIFFTHVGNRTRGNCLEGSYVTITPRVLLISSKTYYIYKAFVFKSI